MTCALGIEGYRMGRDEAIEYLSEELLYYFDNIEAGFSAFHNGTLGTVVNVAMDEAVKSAFTRPLGV
jgi:hypothetical protein